MTESHGVPSASILTSSFTRAAHARATALGMPGVRLVILPSPLASRSVADVQSLAHTYAQEIISLLSRTQSTKEEKR